MDTNSYWFVQGGNPSGIPMMAQSQQTMFAAAPPQQSQPQSFHFPGTFSTAPAAQAVQAAPTQQLFVIQNPDGSQQLVAQQQPQQQQMVWVQQPTQQVYFAPQPQQAPQPSPMYVMPHLAAPGSMNTHTSGTGSGPASMNTGPSSQFLMLAHPGGYTSQPTGSLTVASSQSTFGMRGQSTTSMPQATSLVGGNSMHSFAGSMSSNSMNRGGGGQGGRAQYSQAPQTHEAEQPDPNMIHSIRPFLGPKSIGSILDTPSKLPLLDTLPQPARKRPAALKLPISTASSWE